MTLLDLHMHSTASDGTLSPSSLIDQITQAEGDRSVVALTDHDTTAGIDEYIQAAEKSPANITVIPGVEISTDYMGEEIHILGLGIRWNDENLNSRLEEFRHSRDNRNIRIIDKMKAAGFDISLSDIKPKKKGAAVARPDIARALVDKGYCKTVQEAFDRYISEDGPFFADRIMPGPETVIGLIKSAGGTAVLAHVLQYRKHFSDEELVTMVRTLSDAGLGGIETYYSGYGSCDIAFIQELASEFRLFCTAGSDYHGSNKPDISLFTGKGDLNPPPELADEILSRFI